MLTLQNDYRLKDYSATGGSVWIAAPASAWTLRVGELDGAGDRQLTILLGDVAYHALRLSDFSYATEDGIANVARRYAETGPEAEAAITEILIAASRLLGGRLSAVATAVEQARVGICNALTAGSGDRRAAAKLLAEGFGFTVTDPDRVELERAAEELGVDLNR
jgi:hypothetical protein